MSEYHKTQDPKYNIEVTESGVRLVNSATGKPIPDDEPIFIFRAKDVRAAKTIQKYGEECTNPTHQQVVRGRVAEFEAFRRNNPSVMKEPDTNHAA